jgi:uncharacterized membrane protein
MATQHPTQPAPEPSVTVCAATTSISGLTRDQLEIVLQSIAGRADTLVNLLAQAQCDDGMPATSSLDAAFIIASGIGAMADTAAGGANGYVIGGHDHWNFGPNFAVAGKAVQS